MLKPLNNLVKFAKLCIALSYLSCYRITIPKLQKHLHVSDFFCNFPNISFSIYNWCCIVLLEMQM